MLPMAFLSRLKPYKIEFGGATVKVDVFDFRSSDSFLEEKLSQLEKTLHPERRVVGLSFKQDPSAPSYCCLLMCFGNHCLLVELFACTTLPLIRSKKKMSCLERFLCDRTICFVGVEPKIEMSNIIGNKWLKYGKGFRIPSLKVNAWPIGYLVARFRQKPALSSGSLQEMGIEVGLDAKPNINHKSFDWNAEVFSKEDIKFAVYDVYYSSRIANKLMGG